MAKYAKISLVSQANVNFPYTDDLESIVQRVIAALQAKLDDVLPDQPDLILFPEACDRIPGFTMEQRKKYYQYRGDRIRDFFCDTARRHHCYIGYSACRFLPDETVSPYRNSTQIIGRDGSLVGIYDKNHLVPSELDDGEIAYGTQAPVFTLDFARVGCAICFDLNYEELMYRYAMQKPDLILFSSMYHGGLMQQTWAYSCRAFFAGAIAPTNARCQVLNPFGETMASSTNYYAYTTARINFDYALAHLDLNRPKFLAAKRKYGDQLLIHDPGYVGAVMLTYEGTDRTVWDIIHEFDILPLDGYFNQCRAHRNEHIPAPDTYGQSFCR